MKPAADKSRQTRSMRPLAAETVRQAGGWTAAWAGADARSARRRGGGHRDGAGAVLTGAIGGIAGGIAGCYGFDCIAHHIEAN